MAKKLPKKIYVRWVDEDTDEAYLDARETAISHSEWETTIKIGVYCLEGEKKIVNTSKIV